ncbi:MAG: ABC transporter ATP-binding protein [Candidatus Hodarchaeales archaeon]|jgi:ATP-binding cassette subfamily B protein
MTTENETDVLSKKRKKSDITLIKLLIPYLFLKKRIMLLATIFIALGLTLQIITPIFTKLILDDAILNNNRSFLQFLVITLLILFFISCISTYFITWLLSYIGEYAIARLRRDIFEKVQRNSMDYFDETKCGDIIARMTADLDTMNVILSGRVLRAFTLVFFLLGAIFVMLSVSPILTLASLVCLPIVVGISIVHKFYLRPKISKVRKTNASLMSQMTENIMGSRVSRSFARESIIQEEFEKVNQEFTEDLIASAKASAVINPFFEYNWTISIFSVLILGGLMVINGIGNLTVGVLILFVGYISHFSWPLIDIVGVYTEMQSAFAAFERIVALLDYPVCVKEKSEAIPLEINGGRIEFNNIRFSYKKDTPIILDNFNLTIKSGEHIAIVGETGAGKSTITKLVARLYDIQKGQLMIDNIDIRDVTLNSLRENIGYVLQEPYLYSESLRYNLSYGCKRKKVSDDKIYDVLNLIGADFVYDLPEKLDTVIGGEEGRRLSVGQKQLLSFARVLLKDPRILLLDEATSSIDPRAELKLQIAMEELQKGRTSIVIAHRLSTVKQSERIIVLNQGKIIEEGSFGSLIEKRGVFYNLFQMQFREKTPT